jgi:glycosyltransferase involved in cell wall biosynthesis
MSGGGERVAVHILRNLDPDRFEVAAASLWSSHDTELDVLLRDAKIPVFHLDKKPGFDPRMFVRLSKVMRQFGSEVVHTHLAGLRYATPAMLRNRVPVRLHTIHNLADKEVGRLVRVVHRLAFRTGVQPVAIADRVLDSFESVYGYRDIPLVPNGIPLDRYATPSRDPRAWRSLNGFAADDVLFVCVARLDPQKNHSLLISSFAAALADRPHAHLLLVGRDTPQSEALRTAAAATGLAKRIHFLGVRSDVPDVLQASDVFVLASDYEGNPLTVMEAMAAGLPVVATAVGGIPELVVHEETGLLVEQGSEGDLTRAMSEMAADATLRQVYGAAGQKRALDHFSAEAMAAGYARLYMQLLAQTRATPGSRVPKSRV